MKPMHAPASAATMSATFGSDTSSATTRMVTQLMVDTPTARPSSPSMRLTELVMPTIHSTVSGMASQPRTMASWLLNTFGFDTTLMTTPCSTAMTAARIWIRNFVHARREMMSSITPVMTMMIDPSRMPRTSCVMSTNRSIDTMKPRKMARPPMRGMGWSCTRRASPGTSMAPSFCARILTTGVSAKLTTNAMRIASMTLIQTAVLRNMRTVLQ